MISSYEHISDSAVSNCLILPHFLVENSKSALKIFILYKYGQIVIII